MAAVREERFRTLADHFLQGLGGVLEIIRRVGISKRQSGRDVFEIGQPDVHQALQSLNGFHPLIGAGVIDDRECQALVFGVPQGPDHLGKEMFCRDQIDIVGTLLLQRHKDFRQPSGRQLRPGHGLGDGIVLAEYTAHIAAGEKDGARAPAAGNNRLFMIIERGPRGKQIRGHITVADSAGQSVYSAAARTQRAVRQIHKIL